MIREKNVFQVYGKNFRVLWENISLKIIFTGFPKEEEKEKKKREIEENHPNLVENIRL